MLVFMSHLLLSFIHVACRSVQPIGLVEAEVVFTDVPTRTFSAIANISSTNRHEVIVHQGLFHNGQEITRGTN